MRGAPTPSSQELKEKRGCTRLIGVEEDVLGERQRVGWRYKAVGRGVMRYGLWQTAQEKDREGSPTKSLFDCNCIALATSSDPFQVPRAAWPSGHGCGVLPCTFSRSQKIRYSRKKLLQRWQQLTRHRVAMAVRGNLYGIKIYRQEIASVFGFVLCFLQHAHHTQMYT